eukprot:GHRQ01023541.1.p1 GENE.GHRQ01023541.1~~GHRQ01023541.1.p1  ORF type:complete len:292 (+),score=51.76 GHRQ01023541.1:234-1109(+)
MTHHPGGWWVIDRECALQKGTRAPCEPPSAVTIWYSNGCVDGPVWRGTAPRVTICCCQHLGFAAKRQTRLQQQLSHPSKKGPGCLDHARGQVSRAPALQLLCEHPPLRHHNTARTKIVHTQLLNVACCAQSGCRYVKGSPNDTCSVETRDRDVNGTEIGAQAESSWLRVVPWSFYKLLKYVQKRYDPKQIMITENGVSVPKEGNMTVQQAIKDDFRVNYYRGYLNNLCKAISEGVKVDTYFAWSFMDNFEWREGYSQRFGINYVDFASPNLTRTSKDSAKFLSKHFFNVGR